MYIHITYVYVYIYYICVCICIFTLNIDTHTYISILYQWKDALEAGDQSCLHVAKEKECEGDLPTYCLVPFDVWTKCRVRDNRLGLFYW